jgi:uncharacterized protein
MPAIHMPSIHKRKILDRGPRAATLLLLCVASLSFALNAHAQQGLPKTKPAGYVNDFAGVLSPSARAQLEALCTEVDQKAHAQIAVVTVKSLDGKSIEDYSIALATQWGIGPKQSSSGVLVLLAAQDRKYRIEVGYGLEPILPDGKVGGIMREAVPYLKEGDYDAALLLMAHRVADVIAQDRGVKLTNLGTIPAPRAQRHSQNSGPGPIAIILLLLFIFFLISNIFRRGGGRRGGPGGGWWVGPMIGGMMGGGGGFGGGGFGGGGGGGGFGGFGGGSFGGGGASGSW